VSRTSLDEILARACRRDPAALDQLVDRYSPRVFGLLYRLTGSRDVAEELTQETFLRLVRTIERYDHQGRFEPWLFRIAANLVRDRARRRQRRGEEYSLADHDQAAGPYAASQRDGTDGTDGLVADEERVQLAAAIDALSPAEREIILLRHYSELSFREIAELLEIPLGTALARAHRALGRLRARMTAREEESTK
jgi:RNA polymerase sigma factor (sigma-70 family)